MHHILATTSESGPDSSQFAHIPALEASNSVNTSIKAFDISASEMACTCGSGTVSSSMERPDQSPRDKSDSEFEPPVSKALASAPLATTLDHWLLADDDPISAMLYRSLSLIGKDGDSCG
ncbi:hypothetical protein IFR05_012950 [Cadophora sp. M221]|nr:hypothetical protein IFR05_012950 [Cadophora sp. M221]